MAPQIKFTPYGIPYLVEFANVRVRSKSSKPHVPPPQSPPELPSKSPYVKTKRSFGSESTFVTIATASSETLASQSSGPNYDPDEEGFYLRFTSHLSVPPRKLSPTRMASLRDRIEIAALDAGLDKPKNQDFVKGDHSNAHFYTGTMGDVREAFHEAGLTVMPCRRGDVHELAQDLGAIIRSVRLGDGNIELVKIALWA